MLELPAPKAQHLGADLTALLDVLFIVLVFLLLSVAVKLNVLEVNLPSAGEQAEVELKQTPKVVSLLLSNDEVSYAIDEQPFSAEHTLVQALAHLDNSETIFIAVDKHVPSEALVSLFAKLSELNIQVANLIVKSE
ncbi:biopolymer transporter ExbD [Pseudoalteromonas sp. McH1-7]|uniref:ExbD/TolR family protein n=1 Tax=Pseudoalteromonas TaxID=53246 RepID=UPI001590F0C0|nr:MULTISPECIES: biopolymer transporter ExbD [Pseudoalteromonas]MDW7548931.1 biopolymer transporter ExbD [Pseudoalteromonas peptidolytica]NUZ11160.1 biopolymer transporter ExbD [Pseudoalteromonas sp. McH1-7]USD30368.1 biopolymer transporter ExbD [Pseudoalteromonas sp. SCSIO 43201]